MSYKRKYLPESFSTGESLNNDLSGIGFPITAKNPTKNPNIEDTLIAACIEEFQNQSSRLLELVVDWIHIHYQRINVDRLFRALKELRARDKKSKNVLIFFSAIGESLSKDPRFQHLAKLYTGKRLSILDLKNLPQFATLVFRERPEDPRFQNTKLIVPEGFFRKRMKSIASQRELADLHFIYKTRFIIGPSFRADIWAHISLNPSLSAYELAKICYSSYEAARKTKMDFEELYGVGGSKTR